MWYLFLVVVLNEEVDIGLKFWNIGLSSVGAVVSHRPPGDRRHSMFAPGDLQVAGCGEGGGRAVVDKDLIHAVVVNIVASYKIKQV